MVRFTAEAGRVNAASAAADSRAAKAKMVSKRFFIPGFRSSPVENPRKALSERRTRYQFRSPRTASY
jgi:hypothetical protein